MKHETLERAHKNLNATGHHAFIDEDMSLSVVMIDGLRLQLSDKQIRKLANNEF